MKVELGTKVDVLIEVGKTVAEVDGEEEFEAVGVAAGVEITL